MFLYLTSFFIYFRSDTQIQFCFPPCEKKKTYMRHLSEYLNTERKKMLHLKFPNRYNARCEPSALHRLKADPFTVNELVSVGFLTNYCTVNLGPVFIYP